jgi:[glutamine synthetase] adenylyltransferase / [glutamine synthetase]-adenylyl-L-tyrosine phosphorylase
VAHRRPIDLEAAFAEGPEPARTARLAADVIEAAAARDAARLARLESERGEALVRVLRATCGVAPFLAGFLVRHPEWLFTLAEDDLSVPRTLEELTERLRATLEGVAPEDEAAALRRFKYRELARITCRDACEDLVPEARVGETLAELSHLAEVILRSALARAAAELEAELGPPVWRAASRAPLPLRFAVLGLGKLGGEELNYSSDVDLVYVYEAPAEGSAGLAGGPGDLAPPEYFSRLAQRFGRLVEAASAEGFLYRIDLDLRPEGALGALLVSSAALADYYDGWAAAWEKAAFMKARPVAGDLDFGWRVVRAIDPMIYQSSIDLAGVRAIREMKAKIEAQHRGAEDDVKLGAGGIRDVEFVAQALQLLHGGRAPQVRGRSAPGALRALVDVGALAAGDADALVRAYTFLRRIENRLQMLAERQTHRLPGPGPGRERLARTLGITGPEAAERFEARLREQRGRVRAHFDALFGASETERVLALFARSAAGLLAAPHTRALLEGLAERFARAIEETADPERAFLNLERFVQGVGPRSFYYGLLLDRPELVPRLATLFGASRYLSALFATHPELIEPVFSDPEHLISSRSELEAEADEIAASLRAAGRHDEDEVGLAALRLFHQRQLVNVGLLDLGEKVTPAEVEAALTDVAEVCLAGALVLGRDQLARQRPADASRVDAGHFLVVGMGKLGSRELGYGSDLDVLFLYEAADEAERAEAQEAFVRLAQKVAWALQTRTAEGICYEVDARLRPSGNQGMLVTSLEGFRRYHAASAAVWERQSLLRARPVAGSRELGHAFEALRGEILRQPLPEGVAAEVHRLRRRMESELAHEGAGRRDLKTGRGGLVDVEMVVQLLQLRHGAAHPELLEPAPVETLLARIEAAGLLPSSQVAVLRDGWRFLQHLASRLRIVENRSISDWSEDRADLDSVARALGYPASARTGTARLPLLEDYRRHTEAIRGVYAAVFGTEGAELS